MPDDAPRLVVDPLCPHCGRCFPGRLTPPSWVWCSRCNKYFEVMYIKKVDTER